MPHRSLREFVQGVEKEGSNPEAERNSPWHRRKSDLGGCPLCNPTNDAASATFYCDRATVQGWPEGRGVEALKARFIEL